MKCISCGRMHLGTKDTLQQVKHIAHFPHPLTCWTTGTIEITITAAGQQAMCLLFTEVHPRELLGHISKQEQLGFPHLQKTCQGDSSGMSL